MTKVRVSLSVSDAGLKQLGKVAVAARKAGMKVEQQLDDIGVLTGSIDAKKVELLHRIAGVSSVEEERQVGIPRPDRPVQ